MTRIDEDPGRFSVACCGYAIEFRSNGLPLIYDRLVEHAAFLDEYDLHEENLCCLTVRRGGEQWPFLVVAQSRPQRGTGFAPGALLVPETKVLYLGAGERILAYSLDPPTKIWEDHAETGFLGWEQHDDTVLLCAELEFAAWDVAAQKLWTMSVEPPWEYTVRGDTVELDIMGNKQSFGLRQGPPKSC